MLRTAAALTVLLSIGNVFDSSAAEQDAPPNTIPPLIVSTSAIALSAELTPPTASQVVTAATLTRPRQLPALYGAFATLQVLDMVSTKKALAAGGRELNPLIRKGNMGSTIAIKAASATATVYLIERMWKRNRVAAVVLMVAVNGVGVAVVAHNTRVARR